MAVSAPLRKRLVAVAGAGAFAVAIALLGGRDGIEGRRYVPYQDIAGVWTICDGHTGGDIQKDKTYSANECDSLLQRDLEPVMAMVDRLVHVPLTDYQRAALYSFTYNVGINAFTHSTLLQKLNAGNYSGARKELHRWMYAGGIKRQGLINRRQIESWLYGVKRDDEISQQ